MHLNAKEHKDQIVFMHKVLEGAASKSYGLQVAKLAGIPHSVLEKAKAQLSYESERDSKLKKILQKTSPDELTPKQALELIYELKKLF